MCGFAGIVARSDRYAVDRQLLARMSAAVAHRGPDAESISIISGKDGAGEARCGMAFRRLAILDLDPRAMQPMRFGPYTLVFNGEIYNFRELRSELQSISGESWKTTGDSEVLLRAYAEWGDGMLDRLNGMFALAIFDSDRQTLFLARDRMGQKPLYYAASKDFHAIAFASELSALKCLDWPDFTISPAAISDYFHTGYIPSPATIYAGIKKLPPASAIRCDGRGEVSPRSYFDPNVEQTLAGLDGFEHIENESERMGAVREGVTRAVKRQLVSDVPLGCFLSGGIDSSVIAAAMTSAVGSGQKVLTFSIGFDDPRYDETPYAAKVAAHLRTEHRQFTVTPDAAADLPRLASVFGEPFADSSALPTHYLSRETRGYVKVALSGDGGDELFGGYDRYRAMHLAQRAERIPRFLQRMLAEIPGSHPKSRGAQIRRFARSLGLSPPLRYAQYMSLFDAKQVSEIYPAAVPRFFIESIFEKLQNGRDEAMTAAAVDRVSYLPEDLLTKVDRASMLHALEVRSPFMDHELIGRCAHLSTNLMMHGGPKRLLRQAFARDLPDFVFERKKMGFAVPIGDWLRNSLRPMLSDLLSGSRSFSALHLRKSSVDRLVEQHQSGQADHSQRLYALMMLELWWARN